MPMVQDSQNNLKKEKKVEGLLTLRDFQTSVMNTVQTDTQKDGAEYSRNRPKQLIFNKGTKIFKERKKNVFNKW